MTTTYHILVRRGLKADLPAEGLLGELFFCTDTGEMFVGQGTGLSLQPVTLGGGTTSGGGTGASIAAVLPVTAPTAGDFSVAHGLGSIPSGVIPVPTADGLMRLQTPGFDSTNIYLSASVSGLTAQVYILA